MTRLLGAVACASLVLCAVGPAHAGWWKKKPCTSCLPGHPVVVPSTEGMVPTPTETQMPAPTEPQAPIPAPETADPVTPAPAPDTTALDDLLDSSTSSLETAGGPAASAPFMLGDSFGLSGNFFLGYINNQNGGSQVSANDGSPLAGGRRFKVSESTSPMPRDRVFFTYNFFRDAYQTQGVAGGVTPKGSALGGIGGPSGSNFQAGGAGAGGRGFDVHRYTVGVEKTFFNGLTSAEIRVPFSRTLSNDLIITNTNIPGDEANEFDNISMAFKALLYRSQKLAVSGGLIVNLPTADDITVRNILPDALNTQTGGTSTIGHRLIVRNESVHLSPFLGYLMTPTNNLFIQGFAQLDIPTNNNETVFTPVVNGIASADQVRQLDDQALLQLDVSAGYWVYRNPCARWLTGVASLVELHYTTTLQDADFLRFDLNTAGTSYTGIFGNTANRLDIMNLTVGAAWQLQQRSTVSTGFVFPLNKSQQDQNFLFDWEFQLQLNYQFGPTSRLTRSPIL